MVARSLRALGVRGLAGLAAAGALAACSAGAGDAVQAPGPAPSQARTAPSASAPVASAPPASASAPEPPPPPPDPCGGPVQGMACIPAGDFLRGSREGNPNEQPQATVHLSAYLMDVTEVTVEAHDACVASGKCKAARTIYKDFSRPRQPKVGVRWFDAVDFCAAMHKHLPTEAEWEKAARGADGRRYPWGDEPATCTLAVIMDKTGRSCGVRNALIQPDKGRTFEVASRPPNPYGLYDMAGNAWEWVHDWYSPSYAKCGDACLGPDPKGPCGGADRCPGHRDRVVRGGSWFWDASHATTTYRQHHVPSNDPYHHYGFRCAASLAEAEEIRRGAPPSAPPAAPAE